MNPTTIKFDLTVDDLLALNLHVLYGRLVRFVIVFWVFAEIVDLVQYYSSADFNTLIVNTITTTIAFAGLLLAFYYPRLMAAVITFLIVAIAFIFLIPSADTLTSKVASFSGVLPILLLIGFGGIGIWKMLEYSYRGKNDMTGTRKLAIDRDPVPGISASSSPLTVAPR
jgi:uncharacterized membrane protein